MRVRERDTNVNILLLLTGVDVSGVKTGRHHRAGGGAGGGTSCWSQGRC